MTVPTPVFPTEPSPPAAQARSGWWRTNRFALLALLVLVPLVGIGVTATEWWAYYGYGARPLRVTDVAAEKTAHLNGATWGPVKSGFAKNTSGLDMPEGTRLFVAILPVSPDSKPVSCQGPLLIQQSTGRQWSGLRSEIGIPLTSNEYSECQFELSTPYSLTVGFLVPDDVDGPFWLSVDPVGDDRFLRFSIDP